MGPSYDIDRQGLQGIATYVRTMAISVEVCVTSVAEAEAAAAAGVDTVEVCSWLACGGITPSSGLVDAVRGAVRIPVRVLVRPGPGAFVYAPALSLALLTDTEIYGGGAIGIVTGALQPEGTMDVRLMEAVLRTAPESEITFHRAIDHARDVLSVAEQCQRIGIHRILTSGGQSLALDGVPMLKELVARVGDDLVIAAAGGINPANVVEIVERTGVQEVHFAAQRPVAAPLSGVSLSSANSGFNFEVEPDVAKIEGVLEALAKAGLR